MTPRQTVQRLRSIAAAVENSVRPDRARVAADLRKVLVAMGAGNYPVIFSSHASWENDLGKNPTMVESAAIADYLAKSESNAVIIMAEPPASPRVFTVGAGGGKYYWVEATPELLEGGVTPNDFEGPYDDVYDAIADAF